MKFSLLAMLAATLGTALAQDSVSSAGHGHSTAQAALGSGQRDWTTDQEAQSGSIQRVTDADVHLRLADGKPLVLKRADLNEADAKATMHWLMTNKAPQGFGKPDVTLRLETLQGQMKYDLAELKVRPGAKVQLILHNRDDMHHNLVICQAGEGNDLEVAKAAWALGGDGFAKEWVPEHAKLLHASPMVDPHATRHMYFTAPTQEGTYPYVCTLPGHAAFMKGALHVENTPEVLSELTYTAYHGAFNKLPDFDTLTPVGTDHVPSGLIDLSVVKRRDRFAIVFDGIFNAPKDASYRFDLASDDGSRLEINGEVLVDLDGVHGTERKHKKIKLTKGAHRLRVSYFENTGEEVLYVYCNGGGLKNVKLSKQAPNRRQRRTASGMPLVAENGEARIYRNFIAGAGNRAIGVGYPNGINLAFDADKMRVARIWLGGFMDAARHWSGRGQGHQPPMGYGDYAGPEGVPFAPLESQNTPWPKAEERAQGYRFKGYTLMKDGRWPMMTYQFGDVEVIDYLNAKGDVKDNDARIERSLTLRANPQAPPSGLHFLAARGETIAALGDNRYLLDEGMVMTLTALTDPVIRPGDGGKELLLPIHFQDTGAGVATIQQSFQYQLTAE